MREQTTTPANLYFSGRADGVPVSNRSSWRRATEAQRSVTIRMIFAVVLLLATAAVPAELPPPGVLEHIGRRVYVPLEEEHIVADLYDRFLMLLAGGKIEQGAKFAAIEPFSTQTKTHVILTWSYYIAPSESRGFEISIPKALVRKKGATYTVIAELHVDQIDQKQGVKIITMKRSPNNRVEPAGASPSAGQTNRTSTAGGSRRLP